MSITSHSLLKSLVLSISMLVIGSVTGMSASAADYGGPYHFGTAPTADEIRAIDIDAMPDGRGLPAGRGTYEEGKKVYMERCANCHGRDLGGVKETGGPALVGGRGTIGTDTPKKTVESYWPYATTLFDYTNRAMPFSEPGLLTHNEVYALTAFILATGNIIEKTAVMDAVTLPRVKMPNGDGFISDTRPDALNNQ